MPYFSVIIPLYNKENFIEASIKSVLSQTFTDYEVLVIDDGSTDGSFITASSLTSAKIKYIQHTKNKGLSATRNTGIKNANANYIAFLDADDLWESSFLENIALLIQQFPEADLFASNYLEVFSKNLALLPKTKETKNGIISDYFEASLNQPIYCPSSLCVSKVVFEKIGYYNKQITFAEDVDFNIRANSTFKLAYTSKPLVHYLTISENQITHEKLKHKLIPDFDSYEPGAKNNHSLKKYLDFHRYIFAKMYKTEKNLKQYNILKTAIDSNPMISGLNFKQQLLLNLSPTILKIIQKIKSFLLNKGFRFTSY